jgi:hypothetical protein
VDIEEGAGTATSQHEPLQQPLLLLRQRLPPRPEAGATRAAQFETWSATPCLLVTLPLLLTYGLAGYIRPSHWRPPSIHARRCVGLHVCLLACKMYLFRTL